MVMNAVQLVHSRVKTAIQQTLADPTVKGKRRRELEARLAEVMDFEKRNPSVAA